MEINIKPEDINLYVKNAIMESTIGKNVKEGIEKGLNDLFGGYRNPIGEIMRRELESIVKEYMSQEDVKPKIMTAIAKAITPDAIDSIITYGVSELKKRYDEYSKDGY